MTRAPAFLAAGGTAACLALLAAPVAAAPPAGKTAAAPPAAAPAPPAAATLPEQPKPGITSAAESDHVKRLDAAIAPIRSYQPAQDEVARVRDAIAALAAANPAKAADLRTAIADPVAAKLVDWFRLRVGYGEAPEYRAFLDKNPAWPDRTLLTQRMEEALFTKGGSAASIKAQFKGEEPKTGIGMAALASALLAEGDDKKARALAAKAWREMPIAASLETGFLERFGKLLTPADHKWRLDRLLIDEVRWTGDRKERAAFVRRLIPLLPEGERKKAEARLAVFMKAPNAAALMAAVPADADADWGFAYHKIQQLRRQDRNEEAAKLLLSAPTDPDKIISPDDWWVERRANAYEAMEAGNWKLAYTFVRDAGPLSVNPLKEQSFMAGWIALRKLADPAKAEPHLLAFRKAADGPLSRAKAHYWLGRLAEAKGDKSAAAEHYRAALADPDTFHAMLSRQKLDPGRGRIDVRPPAEPTADEIARFAGLDAAKAVVLARKAGLEAAIPRAFLNHLRTHVKSEGEVALVAHLAEAVGDTQTALRIAKLAVARGQNLLTYAYPVHPFPAYRPLRKPPETAFLLGIARQESEFNTLTVSGAGARGLLQVMPVTANHVCRDYRIKCEIPRLLTDKSYNTMLASAYIADRMDEFAGSYVLTLAGYNAGPGRARQWMRQFGDPRDPKVDVVDWIERIPFQETREYVSKVLANIQMYRARVGDAATALRLEEDLQRGRGALAREPAGAPPAPNRDG